MGISFVFEAFTPFPAFGGPIGFFVVAAAFDEFQEFSVGDKIFGGLKAWHLHFLKAIPKIILV